MAELQGQPNRPEMKLIDDPEHEAVVWEIRDAGLGASARVLDEPDTWEGWEDSAVSPKDIGNYLRDFRALLDKYGYLCTLYGHFGQGLVHTRIDFGLKNHAGIQKYLAFTNDAADLVVRYGEHYDPPQWKTHFKFPGDNGSFSYAIERCVGVGKCRRHEGGTMCPSYMVTREEKHSTRGRSRLLWEMLDGGVIGKAGWRDTRVFDALDLCLACKGCKADCPVNVDMATYKAEFLSHYYKGRLRPLNAYAFGLVHLWARLAQMSPRFVNLVNRAPVISDLAKRLLGVSPQRKLPKFAVENFKSWFVRRQKTLTAQRPMSDSQPKRVVLWPDTFNNYFHPETARAAVAVLEHAGFQVVVPTVDLCCGRPLYDYGMLDTAKRWLGQILRVLGKDIENGTPLVGLEPSCVSVFRDELVNLFSNDENARRLSQQTFLLSEFLVQKVGDFAVPRLDRSALLHGHCHHKAVLNFSDEETLLRKIGLNLRVLDSGCCGLAGSFGFEAEKYEVSRACGERVLLPEVRAASADALIITSGFSCREQIAHFTKRRALHPAEVLQQALQSSGQI